MRFKQGKGDPADFKQFLHQNNLKSNIIFRYVVTVSHHVSPNWCVVLFKEKYFDTSVSQLNMDFVDKKMYEAFGAT